MRDILNHIVKEGLREHQSFQVDGTTYKYFLDQKRRVTTDSAGQKHVGPVMDHINIVGPEDRGDYTIPMVIHTQALTPAQLRKMQGIKKTAKGSRNQTMKIRSVD